MTIAQIETLARFLVKANSTNFTAANLLIMENNAYERIVGKIIAETSGGKWEFGDSNFTALPAGTANLVNAQQNYQLMGTQVSGGTGIDTTVNPLMTVLGVSVLNQNGRWQTLQPITLSSIYQQGIDPAQYYSTNGLPLYYEKREDFLVLYPAPDNGVSVTLASGLKVFFQRTAQIFTSAQQSAGTKIPGFPSPWHDILAYDAAYQYAVANGYPNANQLRAELDRKEKDLLSFMAKRNRDDRKVITTRTVRYR